MHKHPIIYPPKPTETFPCKVCDNDNNMVQHIIFFISNKLQCTLNLSLETLWVIFFQDYS